jgi:hypothetical protein
MGDVAGSPLRVLRLRTTWVARRWEASPGDDVRENPPRRVRSPTPSPRSPQGRSLLRP